MVSEEPATENDNDQPVGPWYSILTDRLPLQSETCVFILVSALDVYCTYVLLAGGGHEESNPVARWFYDRWDMRGMIAFKFSMVAFVCVITQIIARYSVLKARLLLIFLSAIVGAVVVYSLYLLFRSF